MIPHVDPRLPLGERIAALALDLLSPGPMSATERTAVASAVMACGRPADGQLYTLRTTCGVFARGLRYWAGGPIAAPAIGGGLVGEARAWSAPLGMTHRAWLPYHEGAQPEPGDLCFISSQPWQAAKNGHVLTFVRRLPDGRWQTAEGGGGPDGTRCRLGTRVLRRAIDHRDIIGWWRMSDPSIPAVEPPGNALATRDTDPAPPPSQPSKIPGELPPTLRRGAQGPAVRELQAAIGLPVGARDGIFGAGTEAGLRDWQRAHGLPADGIAGPRTWAAIRGGG